MTSGAPRRIKMCVGQITGEPFATAKNLEMTLATARQGFRDGARLKRVFAGDFDLFGKK